MCCIRREKDLQERKELLFFLPGNERNRFGFRVTIVNTGVLAIGAGAQRRTGRKKWRGKTVGDF